jgi:predicted permease
MEEHAKKEEEQKKSGKGIETLCIMLMLLAPFISFYSLYVAVVNKLTTYDIVIAGISFLFYCVVFSLFVVRVVFDSKKDKKSEN